MTRTGLTAKGTATRARLLDVAAVQLAAEGTLEVAAVATAASVAPSVLYRYFRGRDDLVAAVVEDFYDEYDRDVFAVRESPGATWVEREALRLQCEITFFYEHRLGRAIAGGLLREPAATAVDASRTRTQAQAASRNIEAGQRTGELPAHVDAALAGSGIIGAVRAMLADALSREHPPHPQAVAAAALRAGLALLDLSAAE